MELLTLMIMLNKLKIRWMLLRNFAIVIGLLGSTSLVAQDLDRSWDEFLAADDYYNRALEIRSILTLEQRALNDQIKELDEHRSWFNEWYVEYQISRITKSQITIADSLYRVQDRITTLEMMRRRSFASIRNRYELRLRSSDRDPLTEKETEQAFRIANLLMKHSQVPPTFPNYSSIYHGEFGDEKIKALVLQDLVVILQNKLVMIDSLIADENASLALVRRLREFQSDISLQMETEIVADVDGINRSIEGNIKEIPVSPSEYNPNLPMPAPSRIREEPEDTPPISIQVSGAASIEMDRNDSKTGISPTDAITFDLKRLNEIRIQYEDLLQQIYEALRK